MIYTKSKKVLKIASLIAILLFGMFYFVSGYRNGNSHSYNQFKITGKYEITPDYSIFVIMDGYEYSSDGYGLYFEESEDSAIYEIEKPIGKVRFDMRGCIYTGKLPNFTATLDKGTKIYKIKNMKTTRAIMVKLNGNNMILTRSEKYITNEERSKSIGLNVADVFDMMSDQPTISAVIFTDDSYGFYKKTSRDKELINLLNQELPKQPLLSFAEIGKQVTAYDTEMFVNVVFEDGSYLFMIFYPEQQFAYVFGAHINISKELADVLTKIYSDI